MLLAFDRPRYRCAGLPGGFLHFHRWTRRRRRGRQRWDEWNGGQLAGRDGPRRRRFLRVVRYRRWR